MDWERFTLYAAIGGAAGLGVFWWLHRDEPGDIIDQLGDAVVMLTSTDESRLSQLEDGTQAQVRGLIQDLANEGISVHVGTTLRTPAQEKAAIDAGRSAQKKDSWHEIGRAVDLYPIDPDTGSADLKGVRDDLFQRMHALARARGFRTLAYEADGVTRHYLNTSKGKTWDGGHIEWRDPYGTLAEAIQAEGPLYGVA
jgi:hypothetical protein